MSDYDFVGYANRGDSAASKESDSALTRFAASAYSSMANAADSALDCASQHPLETAAGAAALAAVVWFGRGHIRSMVRSVSKLGAAEGELLGTEAVAQAGKAESLLATHGAMAARNSAKGVATETAAWFHPEAKLGVGYYNNPGLVAPDAVRGLIGDIKTLRIGTHASALEHATLFNPEAKLGVGYYNNPALFAADPVRGIVGEIKPLAQSIKSGLSPSLIEGNAHGGTNNIIRYPWGPPTFLN